MEVGSIEVRFLKVSLGLGFWRSLEPKVSSVGGWGTWGFTGFMAARFK